MTKQQRSAQTRETVVLAAARLFARRGYRGTTLNDIALAAHATQGAVYFHFSSKQDLAAEVIRREHETSIRVGLRCLAGEPAGLSSLVMLSGEIAKSIMTDPVAQAGMRLSTESVAELADSSRTPYLDWLDTCRRFLHLAAELGETRDGLDLDAAGQLVVDAFTGAQTISTALTGGADLLDRLSRTWPLIFGAIVRDPEHPAAADAARLLRAGAAAHRASGSPTTG